jgi:hypothetical protein
MIGTGSCEAVPLTVVYSASNRKLGFVLIEAPPGMRGGFLLLWSPDKPERWALRI